jgi:hypothetical protein
MTFGDKLCAFFVIIAIVGIFYALIKETLVDLEKAENICNAQVVPRKSHGFKLIDGKLYAVCSGSDKAEDKNPILREIK